MMKFPKLRSFIFLITFLIFYLIRKTFVHSMFFHQIVYHAIHAAPNYVPKLKKSYQEL